MSWDYEKVIRVQFRLTLDLSVEAWNDVKIMNTISQHFYPQFLRLTYNSDVFWRYIFIHNMFKKVLEMVPWIFKPLEAQNKIYSGAWALAAFGICRTH